MRDRGLLILHCHYHGCWRHDDPSSQANSSYDNVIVSHNTPESILQGLYGCAVMFARSIGGHFNEHDGVSNHWRLVYLRKCLFRRRSKKASKFHVTGLYEGNPPVTGGFLSHRVRSAEIVSIWWRHHSSLVLTPEYSGIPWPVPLLMISWRRKDARDQQPWCWLCRKMRACLSRVICSISVAISMSWNDWNAIFLFIFPYGTKSVPEPMLTSHPRGSLAFTRE